MKFNHSMGPDFPVYRPEFIRRSKSVWMYIQFLLYLTTLSNNQITSSTTRSEIGSPSRFRSRQIGPNNVDSVANGYCRHFFLHDLLCNGIYRFLVRRLSTEPILNPYLPPSSLLSSVERNFRGHFPLWWSFHDLWRDELDPKGPRRRFWLVLQLLAYHVPTFEQPKGFFRISIMPNCCIIRVIFPLELEIAQSLVVWKSELFRVYYKS